VSLSVFSSVLMIAMLVSSTSKDAFVSTTSRAELDARVKVALDRVAIEIEMASVATLDPQLSGFVTDSDQLSMQQVVDITAGAPDLGDVLTIAFADDPAEAVNGIDDDGDGVVDEGRLVMTRDDGGANPQTVVLCKDVRRCLEGEETGGGDENGNGLTDESGFLIQRVGDLLMIQLSVEGALPSGETTVRTSTTSVMLRNL